MFLNVSPLTLKFLTSLFGLSLVMRGNLFTGKYEYKLARLLCNPPFWQVMIWVPWTKEFFIIKRVFDAIEGLSRIWKICFITILGLGLVTLHGELYFSLSPSISPLPDLTFTWFGDRTNNLVTSKFLIELLWLIRQFDMKW